MDTPPGADPKEAAHLRKWWWVPIVAWAVAGGTFAFERSDSVLTIIGGASLGALIGGAFVWSLGRYSWPKRG